MADYLPDTLKEWLGDRPRPRPTLLGCIDEHPPREASTREHVRWANRALLALARHHPGEYLLSLAEDLVLAASSGAASNDERWNLIVDSQINVARLQLVYEPDGLVPTLRAFSDLADRGAYAPGGRCYLPATFEQTAVSAAARVRFQLLAAHSSIYSAFLIQNRDWNHLARFARSFVERWPRATICGISEPIEILAHTSSCMPALPGAPEPHHLRTYIITRSQFEIARIRRGDKVDNCRLDRLASNAQLHREAFSFPATVDAILAALASVSVAEPTEVSSQHVGKPARDLARGEALRDMVQASLPRIKEGRA